MRRKDIEDMGIWQEIGRCHQHCPVCDRITLHIDYQHKVCMQRGEKPLARMCQNHCDIELDETIVDEVFLHEPTGLFIHIRFDMHHWNSMHRGPNTHDTDPHHISYSYSMDASRHKSGTGSEGGSAGPFNTNFYPDDYYTFDFDNRDLLKKQILMWAHKRATERWSEHIKPEHDNQLTLF